MCIYKASTECAENNVQPFRSRKPVLIKAYNLVCLSVPFQINLECGDSHCQSHKQQPTALIYHINAEVMYPAALTWLPVCMHFLMLV